MRVFSYRLLGFLEAIPDDFLQRLIDTYGDSRLNASGGAAGDVVGAGAAIMSGDEDVDDGN